VSESESERVVHFCSSTLVDLAAPWDPSSSSRSSVYSDQVPRSRAVIADSVEGVLASLAYRKSKMMWDPRNYETCDSAPPALDSRAHRYVHNTWTFGWASVRWPLLKVNR